MLRLFRRLRPVGAFVVAAALVAAAGASAQPQAQRVLRVATAGDGVVTTANGGIRCGTRCVARFNRGARVTLTATPSRYFDFERWTGGCVGTAAKCVVVLDQATSVRAVFTRKEATLALAVSGPGDVVSDPAKLSCGAQGTECSGVFPQGIPITLNPVTDAEAALGVWGGPCRAAGTGACRLVLEDDTEVSAAFRFDLRNPGIQSLFVTVEGETRVVSDPAGIDCPTTCEAEFPSETMITLRAERPQTWGVSCVGITRECVLFLDDAMDVSAEATPVPPQAPIAVDVTVSGRGAVRGGEIRCGSTFGALLDCDGLYPRGTTLVLRAVPQVRARFAGWGGSCAGTKLRCVLLVNAPKAVYAAFRRRR